MSVCVFPCSGGEEHEEVGGDEGGDRIRPDVLHACQDGHELQQRLHARPHALPLQEPAPSSHRHHLQVCPRLDHSPANDGREILGSVICYILDHHTMEGKYCPSVWTGEYCPMSPD